MESGTGGGGLDCCYLMTARNVAVMMNSREQRRTRQFVDDKVARAKFLYTNLADLKTPKH